MVPISSFDRIEEDFVEQCLTLSKRDARKKDRVMSLRCFLVLLTFICLLSPGTCVYSQITLPKSEDKVLGTISGRVTLDHGEPAVGFTVYATPQWYRGMNPQQLDPNHTVTDKDGRYSFVLHPSKYNFFSGPIRSLNDTSIYVAVLNGGKPYIEPDALRVDPVKAPNHAVMDADFVLHLGPQIIVHAHDAITHAPIPGILLNFTGQSTSEPMVSGVTGADGTFATRLTYTDIEMSAMFPDSIPRAIEFAPPNGPSREDRQRVQATPGKDLNWELKTYGSTQKSDWHGVVLDRSGHPAAGVPITLLRQYNNDPVMLMTDAQGRFSAQLPRIQNTEAGTDEYDQPPVIFARQGNLIAAQLITPDESWDGMTLHLAPGASIEGRFTDLNGDPAGGAGISLCGMILGALRIDPWQPNSPEGAGAVILPKVITDDHGHFMMSGLPPGSYHVQAHGGGWGDQLVPANVSIYASLQPSLDVAQGQHRNIGTLTLPRANKVLTGTVVDTQGHPAPSLWMTIKGMHTNQIAVTQPDGTFYVYHVVDEPLTVDVGVSGHDLIAKVAPGQTTVSLVVSPDVIKTETGDATPPVPMILPTGPPKLGPVNTSVPVDNLVLTISTDDDGVVRASVLRPNPVDVIWGQWGPADTSQIPVIWHGSLADLDGFQIAVKNDQGKLIDRSGRVLWSGVVVDPPDYTVTTKAAFAPSTAPGSVTVQDSHGKTLWSGKASMDQNYSDTEDLQIIGPQHTVVFERALAGGRVAQRWFLPDGTTNTDWRPVDAALTLHLTTLMATARASDHHLEWSGSIPALTTTLTRFPPMPPSGKNGKQNRALSEWQSRRFMLPADIVPLSNLQDVPDGTVLSFSDLQGHALPGYTSTYHYGPARSQPG